MVRLRTLTCLCLLTCKLQTLNQLITFLAGLGGKMPTDSSLYNSANVEASPVLGSGGGADDVSIDDIVKAATIKGPNAVAATTQHVPGATRAPMKATTTPTIASS